MRTWEELHYTNTFKEMVDLFNKNSNSSDFLDSMTGTILSNGVLYNGKETVDGMICLPLQPVAVSGVVNSNTVFDNFTLYYRDTNKLINLDQFPIDLLSYANGKPQFLYIKEDLSYRVSDYMFGQADEILLARFIINTNSTWNQLYIMAQRAGTPMYDAADEFYQLDGLFVHCPLMSHLALSYGTVKRSGIEFSDKASPDLYHYYNTNYLPIRYVNIYNEVDYSRPASNTSIKSNKYMTYQSNYSQIADMSEHIRIIRNMYYRIDEYSNAVADELHTAITVGGTLQDLTQIVDAYVKYITDIYDEVNDIYTTLGGAPFTSVRRADLLTNSNAVDTYLDTYLRGTAIQTQITEDQVTAIQNMPAYLIDVNPTICDNPLDKIFDNIQTQLDAIPYTPGTIGDVPKGKFTIQRILWDIYENVFIVQYGDTVYDTFDDALAGAEYIRYPAPYGKTIYIPVAILIIKSGTTDINTDPESVIIDRKWVRVNDLYQAGADNVARGKADKALKQIDNIINGTTSVGVARELQCTIDGNVTAKGGDYYLNYNNLNNRITVYNGLNANTYIATQALSAFQGKVLNDAITEAKSMASSASSSVDGKVSKSGDTMTGTLRAHNILPTADNSYNLRKC